MPASERSVGTVERILALKKLSTVGSLPAPQLAVVAEHARERFFPKGSALLMEGEPIGAIHLIMDGKVHIARQGRVLGHAGPGAAVGGIGIFARDPEGIGAVAETDTLSLELDADALLEIFEDHFTILHHMLRVTCGQLLDLLAHVPLDIVPAPKFDTLAIPSRELDLVERLLFLGRGSPFAKTSLNALAELSRALTEVRFDPGVTLWEAGDPSGSILLIVSGTVSGVTASGLTFQVGPGTPLGALESLAERPRWFTARTKTKVAALQGNLEILIDVFEDNFEMALDYLAVIARWTTSILQRTSASDDESLERLYGCDEAHGST